MVSGWQTGATVGPGPDAAPAPVGPRWAIGIGGSAGALEPLRQLLTALPVRLPAAVFVVLHVGRDAGPGLVASLAARTPWAVSLAEDGEPVRAGHVHVAPPRRHLLVEDGTLRVVRGPREQGACPAIDPLFRSLARRVDGLAVGVLLSGQLGDGAAGLHRMRTAGGLTIVQAPADAVAPSIPERALALDPLHRTSPALAIAAIVAEHIDAIEGRSGPRPVAPAGWPPSDVRVPPAERRPAPLSGPSLPSPERIAELLDDGPPASVEPFTCPDCGGVLRSTNGSTLHFRCRVGHAWGADDLHEALDDEVERALWVALRTLQDQAELTERLLARADAQGRAAGADRLRARLAEARTATSAIWSVLTR